MAKFCGKIGFIVKVCEEDDGIWKTKVEERNYRGDITRNNYRWQVAEKLNDDFELSNTISIVADAFSYDHLAFIRYVRWMGSCWKVNSIEVQRPRIILTLGGVYNGEVQECC